MLANLAATAIGFAFFANGFIVSQKLLAPDGYGLGLTLVGSGAAQMVNSLAMIVIPPIAARVATRFSARFAALFGSVLLMAGYLIHLVPGFFLPMTVAAMVVVSPRDGILLLGTAASGDGGRRP